MDPSIIKQIYSNFKQFNLLTSMFNLLFKLIYFNKIMIIIVCSTSFNIYLYKILIGKYLRLFNRLKIFNLFNKQLNLQNIILSRKQQLKCGKIQRTYQFNNIFINFYFFYISKLDYYSQSQTEEMGCAYGTTKQIQGSLKVVSPNKNDSRIVPKIRTLKKLQKINGRQQIDKQKLFENVRIVQDVFLTKEDQSIISNILKSHFFFYKLNQLEKDQIVKKMTVCEGQVGKYIFKQGDSASAFFIIAEGSVEVQISGGQIKKILKRGDYFGELALIYSAPRSASILVKTPVKLWCITRSIFRNSVQTLVKSSYETAKNYINKCTIFNFLTQSQKDSIAFSMLSLKYAMGQIIFKQHDDANSFFIVTKGKVQISIKGKNNLILGIAQSFGQQSFLEQQLRGGTAIAKQQTVCLSIGREAIKNILGDKIINIMYYNIQKWALKRSKLISTKLSNLQLQKLLQTRNFKFCKNGQIIFKKDQQPDKFVICLQGKINGKQGAYLIGEQFINSHGHLKVNQDWIKQQDGLISIIKYEQIQAITEKKISELNKRKQTKYERKMQQVQEKSQVRDFSQLKIEKFIHIKKLGQGQFGKVHLIKQSATGTQYYALKCIQKQQVIESKMEKIILEERNILKMVNSPFLIRFIKCFKDNYFIYFLTEYIKGSELFDVIRQIGLLTKIIARFYISSLILSIQYLHLKNIIYRDLKPENVMVQNNGYLKLIDMGTAKQLKQYNGFRTFTIIGTPHYMAPQVMQGKGYSFAVDIWSLGIVLYEFLCGHLPFGQDLEDPYEIHSQVMRNQVVYPSFYTDTKGKKLIEQMLHKIPELRLPKGFASLKANTYFDDFNWQALYQKQMKSPYIPKKARIPQKPFKQGTLFLNTISRQKSKLPQPRQSHLLNWDADF